MIRKLLLPALFVGLLGGCVTDYGYRDGYYYGQPRVEYRYHDYGYPYGSYPYGGYYPYYYPYGSHRRYYNYNYNYYPYYYRYGSPYYYNPDQRRSRPPVTETREPRIRDDEGNMPWHDVLRRRRATQEVPGAVSEVPGTREVPGGRRAVPGGREVSDNRDRGGRREVSDPREIPGGLRAQTPAPPVFRQPPRGESRNDEARAQRTQQREERRRRVSDQEP